jgi:hemoglobin
LTGTVVESAAPPRANFDIDEAALALVVERFYSRVQLDPLLGPIFDGAVHDWPKHVGLLKDFWSSVMLTSGRYKGRPLPAHLKHAQAITPQAFERWLALWQLVTDEVLTPGAAAAIQCKAARIAESLSLGIRYSRKAEA